MLGNSISGVIFDLDGTLADTSPDIAAALNAALRDTGQTLLPVPDVISMIGDGIPTLVERAIARLGASGSLQDVNGLEISFMPGLSHKYRDKHGICSA